MTGGRQDVHFWRASDSIAIHYFSGRRLCEVLDDGSPRHHRWVPRIDGSGLVAPAVAAAVKHTGSPAVRNESDGRVGVDDSPCLCAAAPILAAPPSRRPFVANCAWPSCGRSMVAQGRRRTLREGDQNIPLMLVVLMRGGCGSAPIAAARPIC